MLSSLLFLLRLEIRSGESSERDDESLCLFLEDDPFDEDDCKFDTELMTELGTEDLPEGAPSRANRSAPFTLSEDDE